MTGSRRPTCTIHIGPPKTGSSSIKHFIWQNEDRLDALGIYFPKLIGTDGKRARNHEPLATAFEFTKTGELKPNAKLWPEIETVARDGEKDILLSSEMFCKNLVETDQFDRVLAFFANHGYRVVVLAYVRDQPAWLNSWYVQSQKRMARLQTFDEFVDATIESGRVEPARYLAPYFANPGCEVVPVSFDKAARDGLVNDFIARIGAPLDAAYDRSPVRNTNAGAKTVYAAQEVMRRLDAADGLKSTRGYPKIYNPFKRQARRLGWEETSYVALDQARYERIRETFAASNDVFAKEHFGMSWAELCPPRTYAPSIFDPATAKPREAKEVERVVVDLVNQFQDRRRPAKGAKAESDAEAFAE